LNLTAYHCLYPKSNDPDLHKALTAYLISDQGKQQLQQHKRTYGDGLDKLEPRDLNHLLVPDFSHLAPDFIVTIATLFDQLCLNMRQNQAAMILLEKINRFFDI
jgi:hypothetical protein